jgi:hypothetical protein
VLGDSTLNSGTSGRVTDAKVVRSSPSSRSRSRQSEGIGRFYCASLPYWSVQALVLSLGCLNVVIIWTKNMGQRTRTLWLPSLASLTGAMLWRLFLQQTVLPSQPLLNHAGLPLEHQLLWLAGLPLFGAVSAYTSRRAGGNQTTRLVAALFPAIVMIPIWTLLATRMSHPSPAQWFGLFCGMLNWVLSPGLALLLGSLPFLASPANWKISMNARTRTFWIPALVSSTAAMSCLSISTLTSLRVSIEAHGWATLVGYIPWVLCLPLCGASGAYTCRRAGGDVWPRLFAALFPVVAINFLVGFLTLAKQFVFAKPEGLHFAEALLLGAVIPSAALLLGAVPFLKTSKAHEACSQPQLTSRRI